MTALLNKVVLVNGRRTSMRMCKKEWGALDEICKREKLSRNDLLSILEERNTSSLGMTYSSRLFILRYFQTAATESGHKNAGHGINDKHQSLKDFIASTLHK